MFVSVDPAYRGYFTEPVQTEQPEDEGNGQSSLRKMPWYHNTEEFEPSWVNETYPLLHFQDTKDQVFQFQGTDHPSIKFTLFMEEKLRKILNWLSLYQSQYL